MVGGFSFYERAEIKDMISYLKLILNPDDSVALMRVINTPVRGIGKTTMETLERIALESNSSLWQALGHVVENRLLPARACAALVAFREIILDARAMVLPDAAEKFAERMEASVEAATDTAAESDAAEPDAQHGFDFGALSDFASTDDSFDVNTFDQAVEAVDAVAAEAAESDASAAPEQKVSTAELLKFLLDRTRYMQQLEAEDSPESLARVENLKELVNAAMDSRDRGESISDFLDHAALVSDVDQYDEAQQITLMTLHAAKGLEFPLVLLVGMEEGLFPHSRTLLAPTEIEEERRLCYVGMTRAMDTLILSRARLRRRYATDSAEPSTPSRFLEEIPIELLEDAGSPGKVKGSTPKFDDYGGTHYDYENEDQSAHWGARRGQHKAPPRTTYTGQTYNSIDNIADFFASRGKKFSRPEMQLDEPKAGRGLRKGDQVRHPKYGLGIIYQREGDGEDARLTVQFERHGLKKLVEKYAQLEKA